MIRIPCPHCGLRDHDEFSYIGDATVVRPAIGADAPQSDWFEATYLRDNPRGPHLEYWQHLHGCRAFIKVLRDTYSHEVLAVGLPGDEVKAEPSS